MLQPHLRKRLFEMGAEEGLAQEDEVLDASNQARQPTRGQSATLHISQISKRAAQSLTIAEYNLE